MMTGRRPRADDLLARVESFDRRVDKWVERWRGPPADRLFYGLSSAADHGLLWFALAALRGAAAGDPTIAIRVGAVLAVESATTNGVVKTAFRRVRPTAPHDGAPLPYGMHQPITTSFPSGHAVSAFTAAAVLTSGATAPLWYSLASLVAASRVYVKMHHASDVVAGAALGVAFGIVARRALSR
jgi:undecaprenyl-diphosphatase